MDSVYQGGITELAQMCGNGQELWETMTEIAEVST